MALSVFTGKISYWCKSILLAQKIKTRAFYIDTYSEAEIGRNQWIGCININFNLCGMSDIWIDQVLYHHDQQDAHWSHRSPWSCRCSVDVILKIFFYQSLLP